MKHQIPRRILRYAGMTAREWKQQKRYEARLLERALDKFSLASAFTPASKYVDKLRVLVRELRKSLKVSNWGN